jgi:hypothetical protein
VLEIAFEANGNVRVWRLDRRAATFDGTRHGKQNSSATNHAYADASVCSVQNNTSRSQCKTGRQNLGGMKWPRNCASFARNAGRFYNLGQSAE